MIEVFVQSMCGPCFWRQIANIEILFMFLGVTMTKDYLFSDSGVVSTVADLVVVMVVATTGMLFTGQKVEM